VVGNGFMATGSDSNLLISKEVYMKKILAIGLMTGIILVMIAGSVFAGNTYDPVINDRIAEQQKRIDEGIASGQLNRAEADILQDNLNWIKAEETRLKADGKLTPKERARLNKMLDRNSNMIYKKKHNPIRQLCPRR
jgi:hypothetical protein